MKYLSLTSLCGTSDYDTLIVPLLCRMINLENLKLYLLVKRIHPIYIDGNELYNQFLIHMTQLKKFTFYITTKIPNSNVHIELPSNVDIQHSFHERYSQQVASYIHTSASGRHHFCNIYSLPYDFQYYINLNNSFQGANFHRVRQ